MVRKIYELEIKQKWIPADAALDGNQNIYHYFTIIKQSNNPKILQNISFLMWSIEKARNTTVFRNEFF